MARYARAALAPGRRGASPVRRTARVPAALAWLAFAGPAAQPARAIEVVQAASFELGADQAIDRERLIVASDVELAGTVRDDLFLLGLRLELHGVFEQDVWAAGDTVRLTGSVGAHARLAGRTVSLEGAQVGRGVLLLGTTVRVDERSRLDGNLRVAAEDAIVRGEVGGDLRVQARRVRLGGVFGGDVTVDADDLAVLPGTRIAGNLTARLPDPLVLDPRVVVEGETLIGRPVERPRRGLGPGWRLTLLAAAYLSFLPWLALFPRFTGRAARRLRASPWRCALAGLVALGLVPLAAAVAAVSLVGLPLAATLAAGYALLLWFAQAIPALVAGHLLLRGEGPASLPRAMVTLLLGLALIHLLALLPWVGGSIVLAVVLLGQGALLLALRDGERPPPSRRRDNYGP